MVLYGWLWELGKSYHCAHLVCLQIFSSNNDKSIEDILCIRPTLVQEDRKLNKLQDISQGFPVDEETVPCATSHSKCLTDCKVSSEETEQSWSGGQKTRKEC